jgi:hypothetical protein
MRSAHYFTYVLIDTEHVIVNRLTPRLLVPNVIRPYIEAATPVLTSFTDVSVLSLVLFHRRKTHAKLPGIAIGHGGHVASSVVLSDGRGINAMARLPIPETELRAPRQTVADELPMHQILAVIDRYAWEEFEGRRNEEIVVLDPYGRWIGVESRQNGVAVREDVRGHANPIRNWCGRDVNCASNPVKVGRCRC